MLGSAADLPKDLLNEVRKLEEIFTVDTAKLKEITNHFVNELAKGMCRLCVLTSIVPQANVWLHRSQCGRGQHRA